MRVRGRFVATTLIAGLFTAAGCGPRWDYEYSFGRQVAESQAMPMLLYFTDPMSSDAFHMEKEVFSAGPVQKELAGCENVKLSYIWGPAPKQYGITTPQVCVLCRPDGSEVSRMNLSPTPAPADFAAWLQANKPRATPASAPGK